MKYPLCLGFVFFYSFLVSLGQAPNVLIIVADDLGWGDLSINGNREVQTPQIDNLAISGMRFDKFYVCPVGATTSASLLTGRYHYRTGVTGESGIEAMMHSSEKTIAEAFQENGYRTAYFGHWAHGDNWPHHPTSQGFSSFEDPTPVISTITFVAQKHDSPFFCITKIPHPRLPESPKIFTKVNQGITTLDNDVGKILHELSSTKQDKRTLVIFLSDNGPDHFGAKTGRFNGYFYGGKGSVHEGGVRVPCFATWPGHIPEKSRFSRMTAHIDWYSTLTELCGLESRSRQPPLDGISLAPALLSGGKPENWPNRILFTSWTPPDYEVKNSSVSVRSDRWLALRDPRWARNDPADQGPNHWELYDLKTDPFQSREIGADYPFLLGDLKADYSFWLDHTTDDGIGPIPIQIGFPEWPEITFLQNAKMTWPIQVIKSGNYHAQAEFSAGVTSCILAIGEKRWKLPAQSTIELSEQDKEIKIVSGNLTRLLLSRFPNEPD